MLVVTKDHFQTLDLLPPDIAARLFQNAVLLTRAVQQVFRMGSMSGHQMVLRLVRKSRMSICISSLDSAATDTFVSIRQYHASHRERNSMTWRSAFV